MTTLTEVNRQLNHLAGLKQGWYGTFNQTPEGEPIPTTVINRARIFAETFVEHAAKIGEPLFADFTLPPTVTTLIVEHRDRLARMNAGLIESALEAIRDDRV